MPGQNRAFFFLSQSLFTIFFGDIEGCYKVKADIGRCCFCRRGFSPELYEGAKSSGLKRIAARPLLRVMRTAATATSQSKR